MPMSKSLIAYTDCKAVLDRALESPKGLKIPRETDGAAIYLQQRLNYFRKLDRDFTRSIFPSEDPRHGVSVYDCLTIRRDGTTVYVQPVREDSLQIEELT